MRSTRTTAPCRRRRRVVVGLLSGLLLLALPALAAAPPAEVQTRVARDGLARVIVTLDAAAPPLAWRESAVARASRRGRIAQRGDAVLRQVRARPQHRVRAFTDLPILALDVDAAELATLSSAPEVLAIELDRLHRLSLDDSVPTMGADLTNAASIDGSGVVIGVLDTGVDTSHPAFAGRIVAEACFSALGSCPNGLTSMVGPGAGVPCTYENSCFHGTHVAGIALGQTTPHDGVARGASLVAVQVFSELSGPTSCPAPGPDPCTAAFTSDIIAGMLHVESLGLPTAAVNLSLGGAQYSSQALCNSQNRSTKSAVDTLLASGIATVAASGNDGSATSIQSPACISTAIGVGVVTKGDNPWSFGNSSGLMDFWGTGVIIESAAPPIFYANGYVTASGTSMAAPHVAGALAVLRMVDPTLTVPEMRAILVATGKSLTDLRNGVTRVRPEIDLAVASLAAIECFDGVDNDGDGDVDFAADPGCIDGFGIEGTQCDNGLDDEGDGRIDWDGGPGGELFDTGCASATDDVEYAPPPPVSCGLGPELALLLPLLAGLRRGRLRAGLGS
jgi:subtilisin family serine protease